MMLHQLKIEQVGPFQEKGGLNKGSVKQEEVDDLTSCRKKKISVIFYSHTLYELFLPKSAKLKKNTDFLNIKMVQK